MDAFEISELLEKRERAGRVWMEFFRVPALSAGIYRLREGSSDPQQPHTEDEIYYVIQGRAQIRVGSEDRAVKPGTLIFIPANTDHRFHAIAEDLVVLVIFAPAEGSKAS